MDPRFLTLGESLATLFTSAFANARGERGSDAHPEVATNASPDTNSEAGSDFYMDIYPDIDSDGGSDAGADVGIDPYSDVGSDAGSDADSESDNESDSSSVVYEHESFATFQSRTVFSAEDTTASLGSRGDPRSLIRQANPAAALPQMSSAF